MDYLVSVVVPTKNRYKYLKVLIKLIDSFNLPELEMVIQDNSDNNSEILEYLKSFSNPNIKYYHSDDKLTMSGNAELGIKNATGEFICYIGDDDGVCRNIVDCVKWMKEQSIEVAYTPSAWYHWSGRLKLTRKKKLVEYYEADKELQNLRKRGMLLSEAELPLLYHGIVSRAVIERMYNAQGSLFLSVPPDIAGSIFLATQIERYAKINVPVVINGISSAAGGGVLNKGGVISLEEVSFITRKDIDEWETCIPPIWCGSYAWTQSGMKTFRRLGRDADAEHFNLDYCLAHAIALRPHKKELWKQGWKYCRSKLGLSIEIIWQLVRKYVIKIHNNIPAFVLDVKGISNVIDAEAFYMKHKGVDFC